MDTCIFCKIVKGEIPSSKVYETNEVLVFLDIKPVAEGHILVIPKAHHEFLYDTPDELLQSVTLTVKYLMPKLKSVMGADSITISIVGIDVPHFHVHLIPRYKNDNLPRWPEKDVSNEDLSKTAEKIKLGLV